MSKVLVGLAETLDKMIATYESYAQDAKDREAPSAFYGWNARAEAVKLARAAMTEVDSHEILGWAAEFLYTNRIPDDKVEKWPDYFLAHIKGEK